MEARHVETDRQVLDKLSGHRFCQFSGTDTLFHGDWSPVLLISCMGILRRMSRGTCVASVKIHHDVSVRG